MVLPTGVCLAVHTSAGSGLCLCPGFGSPTAATSTDPELKFRPVLSLGWLLAGWVHACGWVSAEFVFLYDEINLWVDSNLVGFNLMSPCLRLTGGMLTGPRLLCFGP